MSKVSDLSDLQSTSSFQSACEEKSFVIVDVESASFISYSDSDDHDQDVESLEFELDSGSESEDS